jgi:hypothetical protein
MRLAPRSYCAAVTGLLLLAGSLALAGPAGAVPPAVTLTGSAPAVAHGPGTVTFTYTAVVTSTIDTTTFLTHQDPALPALSTGVTLDGAAVPAGQVIQVGGDIGVQVGADPLAGLTIGTHTITFTASVGTATATTSSTATLHWTASAVADEVTSAPVLVALNQIDIATTLTPDFDEDQTGFLGTGEEVWFGVDVQNVGYGAPDSQLVFDMGTGLALGPDGVFLDSDESPLPCTVTTGNPQQLACDLGVLTHAASNDDPTIYIDLIPTADAPIGQTVAITATASPKTGQGTDINPDNDSATAHLEFTGAAALTSTITPAAKTVQLGATTTVQLSVHNAGPQLAGDAVALSIVTGDNLTVTRFSGDSMPPSGMVAAAKPAAKGVTSTEGIDESGDMTVWFAGDIAAGQTVSATLTVKATSLGVGRINLMALSDAGNPNCSQFSCPSTVASLRVVPVPPPVVAPTAATTTSGLNLASTGPDSGRELGAAALLLLFGSLLLKLGARRRVCGGPRVR